MRCLSWPGAARNALPGPECQESGRPSQRSAWRRRPAAAPHKRAAAIAVEAAISGARACCSSYACGDDIDGMLIQPGTARS